MAWSNVDMQQLALEFVPCADEVHRLQTGADAECELFQRFSDRAHYRQPDQTRQGIYAVTANGTLLGSLNHRNPRRIRRMLDAALERWRELSMAERQLAASDRNALRALWRWSDEYPSDGLVLEVTARDLPRDGATDTAEATRRRRWTEGAWNRDYAWFRAEELRTFMPTRFEVGERIRLPDPLLQRIVRFHLVDNVRGQTSPFEASEASDASLTLAITAIGDRGVEFELSGATHAAVTAGEFPRSLDTTLVGTARWDRAARRFVEFELVASGSRQGATRFNERDRDRGPAPIGFVLRLAPSDAPRVAPAFVWSYGWRPRER